MSKEIGLEDIAGQIANAKTLGLTFTEHDFMALTKGVGTTQELTEEQLQAVAGGGSGWRRVSRESPPSGIGRAPRRRLVAPASGTRSATRGSTTLPSPSIAKPSNSTQLTWRPNTTWQ